MDKYTLIESYIMNQLKAEDKADFENQMEQDPELLKDVEAHAKMKVSMNHLLEEDVLDVISKLGEGQGEKVKVRKLNIKWVSLAASVLILLSACWWMFRGGEDTVKPNGKYDLIFENYFHPVKSFTTRSSSGEEIYQEDIDKYLLAIKKAESQEYDSAIALLEELKNSPHDDVRENAEWNRILILVKSNPTTLTLKEIEELCNENSIFKVSYCQLLVDLES